MREHVVEERALWKVAGTDVKTICNIIGSGLMMSDV